MIKILHADITTLEIDAIVNAANGSLLGGGGVDGAIHIAAGPKLLNYNRTLGECPTGEARISPGFNCPAKWIISVVGPVWQAGEGDESVLLENCYRNAFQLAIKKQIKSIAFPAVSTGTYGYPKNAAAKIALSVMKYYESQMEEIIACCFSAEDVALYERISIEIK